MSGWMSMASGGEGVGGTESLAESSLHQTLKPLGAARYAATFLQARALTHSLTHPHPYQHQHHVICFCLSAPEMWQSSNRTQEAVSHRPPRKAFVPGPRTASTRDHNGYGIYAEKLPPFHFHVYILNSAERTLQDLDFPPDFVDLVERTTFLSAHAHFESYSSEFNNVLACTAHQRREVESRNRNALWPRLISSSAGQRGSGYKGFILVIDRDQWESNGVIVADFDAHGLRHEEALDLSGGDETVLGAERKYMPTDRPNRITL